MLNFLKDPLASTASHTLQKLPAPGNISTMWNLGSLLSLCLITQILTGLLIVAAYAPGMEHSFKIVWVSMEAISLSWFFRYIHANGASLFFICLFIHTARGMYFQSYKKQHAWTAGVSMLLLTMATAFMGYVLPVNQMSFWGASVITNLFSEIPYIGPNLVKLIWGGPSVQEATVNRMLMAHYLLPFVILVLTVIHITYLHSSGSSNPMGMSKKNNKVSFEPMFSVKDLMGVFMAMLFFMALCSAAPLILGDDENFVLANPSVTPHHIQPEWYFLFAYAILRSIPNKFGGVVALATSVLILYSLPYTAWSSFKTPFAHKTFKLLFKSFVITVVLLSWLGMRSVEDPYILTGQILTAAYFMYFLIMPGVLMLSESVKKN